MLKYLFAAILMLLATDATYAQTTLSAPAPKSTTIVITLDSLAPADAYRMAARVLMDAGYQVANSDADLMRLDTDWGEKKGFVLYQLQLSLNVRENMGGGSEVRLHGQYRIPNNTLDTKALMGGDYNVGKIEKRSNGGKYWKELDALALKIGGRFGFL